MWPTAWPAWRSMSNEIALRNRAEKSYRLSSFFSKLGWQWMAKRFYFLGEHYDKSADVISRGRESEKREEEFSGWSSRLCGRFSGARKWDAMAAIARQTSNGAEWMRDRNRDLRRTSARECGELKEESFQGLPTYRVLPYLPERELLEKMEPKPADAISTQEAEDDAV
jgi:hypothetical protein